MIWIAVACGLNNFFILVLFLIFFKNVLTKKISPQTYLDIIYSGGGPDDGPAHHAGEDVVWEVGARIAHLHKTLQHFWHGSEITLSLAKSP